MKQAFGLRFVLVLLLAMLSPQLASSEPTLIAPTEPVAPEQERMALPESDQLGSPGSIPGPAIVRGPAEPTLIAPTEPVPIGGFADVEIRDLAKPDSLTWSTIPDVRVRVAAAWGKPDTPILSIPSNSSGTFNLVIAWIEGDKVVQRVVTLVIGTPTPVPPGPVPPGPTPTPTPSGKRTVLIIRETADTTPEMARLVTAMRNGENAAYLTSKGHRLSILDDDSVDANGQPTPVLASWRPHFASMTLPVVFIIDTASGQLVHKQEIPSTATAADVMAILRGHE